MVWSKMVIQAVTVLGYTILYNKGEMFDKRDEVTGGCAIFEGKQSLIQSTNLGLYQQVGVLYRLL